MSPFAKLMLRFGWIRLSSYGLEVTLDGRLVSARLLPEAQLDLEWSNVPSPSLDLASTFDPALATIPTRTPPPLPAAKTRTPVTAAPKASAPPAPLWPVVASSVAPASVAPAAPADDSLSEEEEWAWQAAVARAKAESDSATMATQKRSQTEDEATGLADTGKLPGSIIKQPPQPARPDLTSDTQVAAEQPQGDGEDWEVLVAAARTRERSAADTVVRGAYDDTTIDPHPQLSDFAAAQVTRADLPANDDLPAETVTSINAIKLRPLLATRQPAETASQDDEWTAMRRQIEAKDTEENARKMRAMREIQRLQGRAPRGDFRPVRAQPQRKRMAAGTSPAPTARPAISARAAGPALRPSQTPAAMNAGNHDTKIDLPRITERLSR